MKEDIRDLLIGQLQDAYSAEKQALQAMRKTLRKATSDSLRQAIEMHTEQTQEQLERVQQLLEKLNSRPGRKLCEAMRGLVEEAQHEMDDQDGKGPLMDLVIVAGMQRIEHYEIAAYGTNIALANAIGEKEVAKTLSEILEQEKQADVKLTEVTQQDIMLKALNDNEAEGSQGKGGSRKRA